MKKTFKYAALALAVMSSNAFAQESTTKDKWIGFNGIYYNTEETKPSSEGIFDDGAGVGAEMGWRFDDNWALRGELSFLELDYQQTDSSGSTIMFGADAMYFLPNDVMYMFGGIKRQIVDQNYNLGNIGLGKHWNISENVKLVTEIAAYHDFGEDYNDYSVKLGVAIPFGASSSSSSVSQDSDGDGVIDARDQCANTPAGMTVDANGCNNDTDGDGVMNSVDQCPDTPAGTQVNAQGCPVTKDSDSDGVNDEKDMCPNTPQNDKVDGDGCTVFDQKEVTHTLRVLFASESAEVTDPRSEEIQDFVQFFKRYGKTQAVIEGHASAPGTEEYNMDLSKRRAEAFKDVLVDMYDIDPSRLETEGFGESQLLDTSGSAQAHRVNRRIMIRVTAIVEVPEERN
ncbi:OmpA family protein [Alteromonas pelagimontana]|uniref:OmpA family protein n=1 Tax=Alteromonas pelagimontana TaxID=1858656 RepID=A0A6M4MDV8_9ALTE|nr:OmpA family protein [Alteromonas pelagimontana]QJR81371.1 OmpA family protein [Alteromonas pelagimontana]